jgi:hypothetical protein
MNKYIVLDNNGETFDRYTIIEAKTGEMIGASEQPFHPLGFGQHCGNIAHNYWVTAYGYGWNRNIDKKLLSKRIKFAVNHFLNDCNHVGKRIKFAQLPEQVQKFVVHALSPEFEPY